MSELKPCPLYHGRYFCDANGNIYNKNGYRLSPYHPCYWKDVDTSVTKVGIDNFRGKSAWAKKKFQRVTHWMGKPEPPQEETK